MLTEFEAWLLLAGLCDNPTEAKTSEEFMLSIPELISTHGLCIAISQLCDRKLLSEDTFAEMQAKIKAYRELTKNHKNYLWPLSRKGYQQRAQFCRQCADCTNPNPNQEK